LDKLISRYKPVHAMATAGIQLNNVHGNFFTINCTSQQAAEFCQSYYSGARTAVLIAGNAGRPAGAFGMTRGIDHSQLDKHFNTQEESVVKDWLMPLADPDTMFNNTIGNEWGLLHPNIDPSYPCLDHHLPCREEECRAHITKQHYNYKMSLDNEQIYSWGWCVHQQQLHNVRTPVDLVFVFGPNVGASIAPTGSTARTLIYGYKHSKHYIKFKRMVENALWAGLLIMAKNEVKIAILALVSGGIYAGESKHQILADYNEMVWKVLNYKFTFNGVTKEIGMFFDMVVLPRMDQMDAGGGRAATGGRAGGGRAAGGGSKSLCILGERGRPCDVCLKTNKPFQHKCNICGALNVHFTRKCPRKR
jgi:hypothetical protein